MLGAPQSSHTTEEMNGWMDGWRAIAAAERQLVAAARVACLTSNCRLSVESSAPSPPARHSSHSGRGNKSTTGRKSGLKGSARSCFSSMHYSIVSPASRQSPSPVTSQSRIRPYKIPHKQTRGVLDLPSSFHLFGAFFSSLSLSVYDARRILGRQSRL